MEVRLCSPDGNLTYLFVDGVSHLPKVIRTRLHGVESTQGPSEAWQALDESELHEEGVVLGVHLEAGACVHEGPLFFRRQPDLHASPPLQVVVEGRVVAQPKLVVVAETDDVMDGGLAILDML